MGTDHNILSVNGYLVLKVRLPSTPSFREPAWHYLYIRRHEPKIPGPDDERTLFVVNIPVDSTAAHFRALFAKLGGAKVESVQLDRSKAVVSPQETASLAPKARLDKRKRKRGKADDGDRKESSDAGHLPEVWDRQLLQAGSSALVVFSDRAGLVAGLKAVKRGQGTKLVWGEGVDEETVPVLGSHRYYVHQRLLYPPKIPLQTSVNAFMTRYSEQEAETARQAKRLRQEPDEDGFITVTRGGRAGPARQEEAQAMAERQKQKNSTGLKNFYRFQLREERKKVQGELLRKFEEDRRKVQEMKRRRAKFKPE